MADALYIGADSAVPATANGWEWAETEHRFGISVAVLPLNDIATVLWAQC